MKLHKNEGPIDRGIRIGLGLILIAVGYLYLTGVWMTVLYVAGAASLITGLIGFCGLYTVLGINTCPAKLALPDESEAAEPGTTDPTPEAADKPLAESEPPAETEPPAA
jgi:hypothetical protein